MPEKAPSANGRKGMGGPLANGPGRAAEGGCPASERSRAAGWACRHRQQTVANGWFRPGAPSLNGLFGPDRGQALRRAAQQENGERRRRWPEVLSSYTNGSSVAARATDSMAMAATAAP